MVTLIVAICDCNINPCHTHYNLSRRSCLSSLPTRGKWVNSDPAFDFSLVLEPVWWIFTRMHIHIDTKTHTQTHTHTHTQIQKHQANTKHQQKLSFIFCCKIIICCGPVFSAVERKWRFVYRSTVIVWPCFPGSVNERSWIPAIRTGSKSNMGPDTHRSGSELIPNK